MRTRYEADNWITEGAKILSSQNLEALVHALKEGPIIVQHWLYRGASCPLYKCFDDIEDFKDYLKESSVPGDAFDIWSFGALCNQGNRIAQGKLPDLDGKVPSGGAY